MRVFPTLAIAACATAAPIQPRQPDPAPASTRHELAPTEIATTSWNRSWDALEERERLTRIGANDAIGLEAEYARVCGPSWPPTINGSPLTRYRTGGRNTSTSAIVYLSPLAGAPDSLLDDIRCHFVGMLLSPFGLDDSAFDLPGLHIDARGDKLGIALVLTVRDPSLIYELHRRVNREATETVRQHHEE
jgi:hypothetical protein